MGRRLGQHFLKSKSILERIARAACPEGTDLVIEVGPGKGALTSFLLPLAKRVIAIEVDSQLVPYLRQKFAGEPKLEIVEADILKVDLRQWGPARVAGNLPYYITSPILEKVLRASPEISGGVFLVQKEVAERITTQPGSRDYGYLSVLVRTFGEPKRLFDVPPTAFAPPPKVDSSVFGVTPHAAPLVEDADDFLKFAQACFRQKRKTLRNNLSGFVPDEFVKTWPEAGMRAEQLGVAQLIELYRRALAVATKPEGAT
jgi:16S rRNA (adenine1518-N6/adenine1519-N6)-dimethyltransferase